MYEAQFRAKKRANYLRSGLSVNSEQVAQSVVLKVEPTMAHPVFSTPRVQL